MIKIRAAVTKAKSEAFKIQEVNLDAPKSHEILVRMVASGVCHTDAAVQHQFIPVPLPAVLGHEGAGIVEKTGPDVTEFKEGDHVCVSFGFCGICKNCRSGHPAACVNLNKINFGGIQSDGTTRLSLPDGRKLSTFFGQSSFASHIVVNEAAAVKVEDTDIDLGLVAPIGCGIQTGAGAVLNVLHPVFGSSIAVFGCGTVGMSAIMAAKIAGCEKIIAVGGNPKSLSLALELGATHTINRKECSDIQGTIHKLTNGGCDYAIDTSGNADFVKKMLGSVGFLGKGVILGATGEVTFDIQNELMGEFKSLLGVVEGDSIPKLFIPKLIEYYKQGRFPIDKLIRFYRFEELNEALEASSRGECIKAVVRM